METALAVGSDTLEGQQPPLVMLTAMQGIVELLLSQAALDRRAGLNTGGFVTGYPGSPVGRLQGALQASDQRLRTCNIHQVPGLNEETAATAVWGSQTVTRLPRPMVDGVFGMWFGKAPGVDRAGDALRHANIRGTDPNGGVLVVAGDDPNANATVFPTDSTAAMAAWGMPVLYPGSVQDIVDLGLHGYQLSRIAGLWVGLKLVTTVADGSGSVRLDLDRLRFQIPSVDVDGEPFRPILRMNDPGIPMRAAERDLVDGRRRLAEAYVELNNLNPIVVDAPNARVGVVAAGKTYYDTRRALDILGLDDDALMRSGIRLKRVSALHPIGVQEWIRFANGLDEVIVVEEKQPFLEAAIKGSLYGSRHQPLVSGKADPEGHPLFPRFGEFGPSEVARLMGQRLAAHGIVTATTLPHAAVGTLLPLTALSTDRRGFFCSGCPHNTSLPAPDGAVVGAGIGCHLIGLLVNREEYGIPDGYTQMGGEGAQWVGQAPFTEVDHIFQNVGDGTFHHSASLALRLAVASDVNMTYKLLYNSAVGMTGGQDVKGAMPVEKLTQSLHAEGVRRIIITTDDVDRLNRRELAPNTQVWHRDRIMEAQELLAKEPGVTVLLHDQQCAADRRRRISRGEQPAPTKHVMINERVCEGCGDCSTKSQCLSVQPVQTAFGRKTRIHQSSCNFDYSCTKGDCPSFIEIVAEGPTHVEAKLPQAPASPQPTVIVPRTGFAVHMVGIGGSGVISANEILARAAAVDGLLARSLDLPGSTIKAGPVVSQTQVYSPGSQMPAATIDPGRADLFLAFDLLGAMTPERLGPLSPERTVVVGAVTVEPTAHMAIDPAIGLPAAQSLMAELDARSRAQANAYLDVSGLSEALLGDHMGANAMLIGAAFQLGAIPFAASSIEQAIREIGVAVEQNLVAFQWGRAFIAQPGLASDLGVGPRPVGGGVRIPWQRELLAPFEHVPELHEDMALRVDDLCGYQNRAYASAYVQSVAKVMEQERRAIGDSTEIAQAYARGLHRLMAYKDEYEVARLLLLSQSRQAVVHEFGKGAKVSWLLHPPVLRALGLKRKLRLGRWFTPALLSLRAMKVVRGSWLDPFGPTKMRRLERALVLDYQELVDRAMNLLTTQTRDLVLDLAASADIVRGYEDVKLRAIRAWVVFVSEASATLALGDGALRVRKLDRP